MVLGLFYFQKYKGHGDGDEQNVMSCLGPDRPGQNAILHNLARNFCHIKQKKGEVYYLSLMYLNSSKSKLNGHIISPMMIISIIPLLPTHS